MALLTNVIDQRSHNLVYYHPHTYLPLTVMRQLSLHASALNDNEYELYTTSLTDLDDSDQDATATHDDAYYEGMRIGVREVRGWMRGRYGSVSPANIDAVCARAR